MQDKNNYKFRDNKHQIANNNLQQYCNFSFVEMQGFITSVVCDTRDIDSSEWLQVLGLREISKKFSGDRTKTGKALIEGISQCAISCFDDIKDKLMHGKYNPVDELRQFMIVDNYEHLEMAVRTWCCGFICGVHIGMMSNMKETEQAELMHPIAILAARDSILRDEIKNCNLKKTVKELRQQAVQVLPETVNDVYQYWLGSSSKPALSKKAVIH